MYMLMNMLMMLAVVALAQLSDVMVARGHLAQACLAGVTDRTFPPQNTHTTTLVVGATAAGQPDTYNTSSLLCGWCMDLLGGMPLM